MLRSSPWFLGSLVVFATTSADAVDAWDDSGSLDMRLLVASAMGPQIISDLDQGVRLETDPDPGWRVQIQYLGQLATESPWRWGLALGTQQRGTEDAFDLSGRIRWYQIQGRLGAAWRATPWLTFECLPFVGYGRASIIAADGERHSDSAWEYGLALTGVVTVGRSWFCGVEGGPLITETYQVYDNDTEYRISGRTFTLGLFVGAHL